MFASRFSAVLDACMLVPPLRRNLLLSLAGAQLYRPRWSRQIMAEVERAIARILGGTRDAGADAARAVAAMNRAFPDACVTGHEVHVQGLDDLPDPDDRHVVAAAIHTKAYAVVTDNSRHFPRDVLSRREIEPVSADAFLAATIDLDPAEASEAIDRMISRLKRPEIDREALIRRLEAGGMTETADSLLMLWSR